MLYDTCEKKNVSPREKCLVCRLYYFQIQWFRNGLARLNFLITVTITVTGLKWNECHSTLLPT